MSGRLDTSGTITPADGEVRAWAAGGSGARAPFEPPPPPPVESRAELRRARKDIGRQLQRSWVHDLSAKAAGYGRFWRYAGTGVVVALVLSFGLPWMISKITSAAATGAQAAMVPQGAQRPVVQQVGIPNPFDEIRLTKQAAIFLGAHDTDGDGVVDALDDTKSATALVAILRATDLCGWFVTVDGAFQPSLSRQPVAGSAPLAECPAPTATTAPVVSTTAVPTSTTAAAR